MKQQNQQYIHMALILKMLRNIITDLVFKFNLRSEDRNSLFKK